MLATLACFCPRFWLWPVAGLPLPEFISIQPEFHRAFHALQQLEHPWMRIDDGVNRVIEWRLFWPLVAHSLGLSAMAFLSVPFLGCLAALGATATIVARATADRATTVWITGLVATSSWFFVSTGWLAYFDSWLIFALLLASFARGQTLLVVTALLAPWIDERFITALPLCLAVRALERARDTSRARVSFARETALLVAGIVPYLAVRAGAEFTGARSTSASYWHDRPLLPAPLWALLWGLGHGLRLGWIFVLAGAAAAFRARQNRVAVVVAAVTLAANVSLADDISRSSSVAIPALVASLLWLRQVRPAAIRRALPVLAGCNFLLPAMHVIAAPGTTAVVHSVAILSAHAELERARHPPEFASAAAYHRRSMDHFQNQSLERALASAEIARRLDPGFAKAIANRGILLYVTGKKKEGLAELDRAIALAPDLYDARMQRASFRQQAGDLRGALEDVRQALQHMPTDWPRRADAQQFERNLAAQGPR